jgi:hypothetical protein
MSDDKIIPPTPGEPNEGVPKLMWLGVALAPTVIGLICFQARTAALPLFPLLVILDVVCSIAGSVGLVRGTRDAAARVFLGLFLTAFFFILNALIVLFIGCSGSHMGRL